MPFPVIQGLQLMECRRRPLAKKGCCPAHPSVKCWQSHLERGCFTPLDFPFHVKALSIFKHCISSAIPACWRQWTTAFPTIVFISPSASLGKLSPTHLFWSASIAAFIAFLLVGGKKWKILLESQK